MANKLSNFRQGDTKTIRVIDTTVDVDITGRKMMFTLRSEFEDVDFVAQVITTAGDHTDDDIPNNTMIVEMGSDITKDIPVGHYYYDLQYVVSGTPPVVKTITPSEEFLRERIEVLPQVTKVE